MSDNGEQERQIYEITHRTTGEKSFQIASNAQDACEQAAWAIADCYVMPQKPRHKPLPDGKTQILVRIPCHTCPFQYGVCTKPEDTECPARPEAPELQEWLKQAAEAHLCPYQGQELTKKDYGVSQKWVTMEQAIKELAPKP